jgi:Uma2 family endonuclease
MLPNLKVPQHIMPLTDDQLFELCAANSELVIERNSEGELIIMSPAGGLTGNRNLKLASAVFNWNDISGLGYTFDSSTGFLLPDHSMLSPDVSWVKKEKWEKLSIKQQEKFPPLCPDFVIELCSPSDELRYVKSKMETWIKNGCQLGWLIDPREQKAFVYEDGNVKEFSFKDMLNGGKLMPGFSFSLSKL